VYGWLWGHSKAEFVIYKLREMGKLDDKDIADVIQEFTELDIHNTGKITRAYLQEGN
jgi:potassium channel subfamily K